MRGMNSNHPEVRDVLSAMAVKVRGMKGSLTALDITQALSGLEHMDRDYIEVKEVLAALADNVRRLKRDSVDPTVAPDSDGEVTLAIGGN